MKFFQWLKKLFEPKTDYTVMVTNHALRRFKIRFNVSDKTIKKHGNTRKYIAKYVKKLCENNEFTKPDAKLDRYHYKDEVWVLVFHVRENVQVVEVVTCWINNES